MDIEEYNMTNGLIIPRRSILKGLFAAPAIVAASNIMPVSTKIFRANAEELISSSSWSLIFKDSRKFWVPSGKENVLNSANMKVVKRIDIPFALNYYGKEATKTTIELMKLMPGSSVYWDLTSDFT